MSMVEGQPEICGRGGQNLNLVEGEADVCCVGRKKKTNKLTRKDEESN